VDIDPKTLISKIPSECLIGMLLIRNTYNERRMDAVEKGQMRIVNDQRKILEDQEMLVNNVERMDKSLKAMWNHLTMIATEKWKCPRYILMIPSANVEKLKWRDWISETVTIYFVCERTHVPVKAFEARQSREWVKKVAPAMSLSLKILAKVGFSVVDPSGVVATLATDFMKYIFDKTLQGFDESLSNFAYTKREDLLDKEWKVNDDSLKEAPVVEVLDGSYEALSTEAAKYDEWKKRMTSGISVETGKLEWYIITNNK
jgi:hypothetical protein